MAAYYLESSALVKRYVAEVGTAWIKSLLEPAAGNTSYVVALQGPKFTRLWRGAGEGVASRLPMP